MPYEDGPPRICVHCFMAEFDPRDELLYCHHPIPPWAKGQLVRGSNRVDETHTCPLWNGGRNHRGMQHAGHASSNPTIRARAEAYTAALAAKSDSPPEEECLHEWESMGTFLSCVKCSIQREFD